eukprot:4627520-Prymnesium_polylepis.1
MRRHLVDELAGVRAKARVGVRLGPWPGLGCGLGGWHLVDELLVDHAEVHDDHIEAVTLEPHARARDR